MTQPTTRPTEELTVVFREHADGLAGAIRGILGSRADVTEVMQEAFLRAWQSRERIPQDPVAWVFVICMNLAKDLRRKALRRGENISIDEVSPMPSKQSESDPVHHTLTAEWLGNARAAIVKLNDREKEVFLLRVSAGRSYPAIADALDVPLGTVKTRMRSALQRLRQSLAPFAPESQPAAPEESP